MSIRIAVLTVVTGIVAVTLALGTACGASDEPPDRDDRREERRAERAERLTKAASEGSGSSPSLSRDPTTVDATVNPTNPVRAIAGTPEIEPTKVPTGIQTPSSVRTPTAVQTAVPTPTPTIVAMVVAAPGSTVVAMVAATPVPTVMVAATLAPTIAAVPTANPASTAIPFSGSPLRRAVLEGNQAEVERLLNLGEDVNAVDDNGKTPLYVAVEQDNPEMAGLLLTWEAHLAVSGRWDLLHVASVTNSIDMAGQLLDRGSDIEAYGDGYWKPLYGPLERNFPEFLGRRWKMEAGAPHELIVTRSDGSRDVVSVTSAWRALHLAVAAGNIKMARLLLDRGADIEARNSLYLAPLQVAVVTGNTELAGLLLDQGADIEAESGYGTPLVLAIRANKPDIATMLLDRGANAKAEDAWGSPCKLARALTGLPSRRFLADYAAPRNAADNPYSPLAVIFSTSFVDVLLVVETFSICYDAV